MTATWLIQGKDSKHQNNRTLLRVSLAQATDVEDILHASFLLKADGNVRRLPDVSCSELNLILNIFMESLTGDGIQDYLLPLNFSAQQNDFRRGHFRITDLLAPVDRWTTITDRTGKADVVYLDPSKLFDSVNHICFINKLILLDIKSPLID